MKLILIFIVALVVASTLAYQVHLDPGYAILSYGNLSIETSLAVFIFISFIAFIALFIASMILLSIKNSPKKLSSWNTKRKHLRSQKELSKGLLSSADGNWKQSEKLLIKHANDSETVLVNYLSAAHAAQSQGAFERRDDYLFKAGEALPKQAHAIHLTRAKLQFSAGQYEQALATLQQLVEAIPNHPLVLTLLLKTYAKLNDWKELYNLLPRIKSHRQIPLEDWQAIEQETLSQLLTSASKMDFGELDKIWANLNKKQKLDPLYLSAYATQKISQKQEEEAEEWLIKALNTQMDDSLIDLYSDLNIDTSQKLKQLGKWLKTSPSNVSLLNQLGRVCLQQQLWGKANHYLDKSIAIKPTSRAYLMLGELYQEQGEDAEKLAQTFRIGLELANNITSTELTTKPNP